jgi:hypothetical protein
MEPWVPKWLAGFAPVGKVLQRNLQQDHAECPRCTTFETTTHVLLCPAPKAQQQWDSSITTLTTWLTKAQTLPNLQRAILSGTQSWRHQTPPPIAAYNWPGINDIVIRQTRLGWRAFLEGAILCDWAAKQHDHYEWLKRKNTGKRWVTTLIKMLWELSWNMWGCAEKSRIASDSTRAYPFRRTYWCRIHGPHCHLQKRPPLVLLTLQSTLYRIHCL